MEKDKVQEDDYSVGENGEKQQMDFIVNKGMVLLFF